MTSKKKREKVEAAYAAGDRIEYKERGSKRWFPASSPRWFWDLYKYRVVKTVPLSEDEVDDLLGRPQETEVTKPSIDWSHVDQEYNWLARGPDGYCSLADEYPRKYDLPDKGWTDANFVNAHGFSSLQPGTCDWSDSLVERPAAPPVDAAAFDAARKSFNARNDAALDEFCRLMRGEEKPQTGLSKYRCILTDFKGTLAVEVFDYDRNAFITAAKFYKGTHPNAEAAAKAECARLNGEPGIDDFPRGYWLAQTERGWFFRSGINGLVSLAHCNPAEAIAAAKRHSNGEDG